MIEVVSILIAALLLDHVFGDPRNKFHPTAWAGALIARLVPAARCRSRMRERLGGVLAVTAPVAVAVLLLAALYEGIGMAHQHLAAAATIVATGVLLKTTLAVRGMERHAMAVIDSLESGDIAGARELLARIVKRDTTRLDSDHIYSGVIESVGENTVDGITGPLFYFGLFGIFGAFAYRIVNTADSMAGYKTGMFRDIGWFAAACDSILNYIPARLTGVAMVLGSAILGSDWRAACHTMIRDGKKTDSVNSGYPMAAMAGALDARLEKPGEYTLGDGTVRFDRRHVRSSIALMRASVAVFCTGVVIPTAALLSYVGWWAHAW